MQPPPHECVDRVGTCQKAVPVKRKERAKFQPSQTRKAPCPDQRGKGPGHAICAEQNRSQDDRKPAAPPGRRPLATSTDVPISATSPAKPVKREASPETHPRRTLQGRGFPGAEDAQRTRPISDGSTSGTCLEERRTFDARSAAACGQCADVCIFDAR